jgi:hypothetical protein
MPVRTVSLSSRTVSSHPLGAETGSQTTEYALIMVVTATKLRGYDDPPSPPDRPELAHASRDLRPDLPSCGRLNTRRRAPGAALPGTLRTQRLGGRRGLPRQ